MGKKVPALESLLSRTYAVMDYASMARVRRDLHAALTDALNADKVVGNNSPWFWESAWKSLFESQILYLIRLYDEQPNSVSLQGNIRLIQKHPAVANEAIARLAQRINATVQNHDFRSDEWVARLAADLDTVTNADPLVDRFLEQRNQFYAHLGEPAVLEPTAFTRRYGLSPAEIDILVDRAFTMANEYGTVLLAQSFGSPAVGHDDYKSIFAAVRERADRIDREMQAEEDALDRDRDSAAQ